MILDSSGKKSVTASNFPSSICHEEMGLDNHDHSYLNVEFQASFSLYSFTLIKRLFSSSSLSAIGVVSFAYLRSIFLPEILIPACVSSSLTFHMMYSA